MDFLTKLALAGAAVLAFLQVRAFRLGSVSLYKQPEQLWNAVLACEGQWKLKVPKDKK